MGALVLLAAVSPPFRPAPAGLRGRGAAGRPAGPLLFAAAPQPVAEKLRELKKDGRGLDLLALYLGDRFMAGDLDVVAEALAVLKAEGAALGLEPTGPPAHGGSASGGTHHHNRAPTKNE